MRSLSVFAIIFCVVLYSCSTRLDLLIEAEPIPVVYFQVNPEDKTNYLTLTRTFTGDANAFELAKDTDKLFYDEVNIRLEGWMDEYKVWETQFKPSEKSKNSGVFPSSAGYCYESSNEGSFNTITSFRLVIDVPGVSSPVFSKIGIVGPPIVKSRFDHQIKLYPELYDIGIAPGPGTAYCDLICIFRYQQFKGIWINRSDTFLLRRDMRFETGRTDYLYAELFFQQIATNIKPVNDTIVRRFTSLDLIMVAGDQYFRDYVETYENAGDFDMPPKGNITNGIGLFTMCRTAIKDNMTLDRITHDSLCLGQFTKQLGFVRW